MTQLGSSISGDSQQITNNIQVHSAAAVAIMQPERIDLTTLQTLQQHIESIISPQVPPSLKTTFAKCLDRIDGYFEVAEGHNVPELLSEIWNVAIMELC
jgi:hypothetical protein